MVKLSSFTAVHYRGLDGFSLPELTKANLITGANGVGKTALLEAMWLFTGRYNPSLLWNPNLQRSLSPILDPIARLTDGVLELSAMENGTRHKVKFVFEKMSGNSVIRVNGDGPQVGANNPLPVMGSVPIYIDGELVKPEDAGLHITPSGAVLYPSLTGPGGRPDCIIENTRFQHDETTAEYLNRYSSLVRNGCKNELIRAVGMVANDIEDVEILTDESGQSYLSVTMQNGNPRTLYDLGGGAVRLFRLLLNFSAARGGILFADELENGIHHSALPELWEKTRQWMEQWDVQFMATSHSGELVDAAIDAFAENPEDLSIYKLHFNENTGRSEFAMFTGEALLGARDLNLEVR